MSILMDQINEHMIRHHSDNGMQIRQIETGLLFDDVCDFIPCAYTYEETNIPVEVTEPPEEEIDDAEALRIIMGVAE